MNTFNPIRKPLRFRLQCVILGLLIAATMFLASPALADSDQIADELNNLSTILQGIVSLLPLILLSALALWKENAVLFMVVAGVAMVTGLYAPDIISGDYSTTPLGISVGLGLIAYSLLCCGWAFRLIFWREA